MYAARSGERRSSSRDGAFADRIGWREVTLSARDGARVLALDRPDDERERRAHRLPEDLLRSPLDVTRATATVEPGDVAGLAAARSARLPSGACRAAAASRRSIARGDLSAGALLLSLLIAMFWGAAHALTPGHGKAMVAAYLVGTKGTPRHALLLGGTVTVAHTAGVFASGS